MATLAQARLTDDERRVLEKLVPLLRDQLGAEAVWLYGSRARGEFTSDESDIDLLVIVPGDRSDNQPRAMELLRKAAEEADANWIFFSIHVWDREWLEHRRNIRSFFIQEVDRDKIVLHGEP